MTQVNDVKTGTTTVGIAFDNGVVLATERRATMGNLIASKKAKKVHSISRNIGMTIAGTVGDAQRLIRIINVESSLYELRRGYPISVGAVATVLSNYLNDNRFTPYSVQLVVGGVDANGSSLYSVDAAGGATLEENFVSTGSGSFTAYGVLEDRFRPNMTKDESVRLPSPKSSRKTSFLQISRGTRRHVQARHSEPARLCRLYFSPFILSGG